MLSRHQLCGVAVFLTACLIVGRAAAAPAPAAAPAGPSVQALTSNLDDAEQSFRYAEAAVAAGDIRGAIAALERVLQINPDLANIKLELGLLYLRAGQPDLARAYISAALQSPEAPEEVRQRARAAIQTAQTQLQRHRLSGSISAGAQYESNPNAAPDGIRAVFGGSPVNIPSSNLSLRRDGDVAGVFSGDIDYRYVLDGQAGNELAVNLQGFQSLYGDSSDIDATYLSAKLGPRFYQRGALGPVTTVRPYVSISHLSLGGDTYFDGVGAGISLEQRLSLRTTLYGQGEYQRRTFLNSARRLVAKNETGDYWSGAVGGTFRPDPRSEFLVEVFGETTSTRAEWETYDRLGLRLAASRAFAPPFGKGSWLGRIGLAYRNSSYKAPDPLVDPRTTRKEDQYVANVSVTIPLSPRVAAEVRGEQVWNNATLPNYRYDNTLGGVTLTLRF